MTVRLYVGNLNPRTTELQLCRFFSSAGLAVTARVPFDSTRGLSRGFGFLDFETEEQAERALCVFDGRRLGNREIFLERVMRPDENKERFNERHRGIERPRDDDEDGPESPAQSQRDDYVAERRARMRRHGKHGSDRVRGRGTRRVIE